MNQSTWCETKPKPQPDSFGPRTVMQQHNRRLTSRIEKADCPGSVFFFFGGNSSTNTSLASPAQICVLGDCSDQGSMKTKSLCNNYSDHFTLWPPTPPVRTQFGVIERRARSRCLFGGWRWRRGQRLFILYKCINTEDTLFIEKIIKMASIMWDGRTQSLFFPVLRLCKRKFGTEAS